MEPHSQNDINAAEWRNPNNWAGIGPFKAYFSKRDSRMFVPGWWDSIWSPNKLNYGHRYAYAFQWFALLFIVVVLLASHLMRT